MKLDHLLTPHPRINSKPLKDLDVRPETMNVIEENIGSTSSDIAHSSILPDKSPQARETKEKINKLNYSKLKKFCTAKENINEIKRQPTAWENVFDDKPEKGLILQIYKVLIKLNTKKLKQPNQKMVQGPK